MSASPVSGPFTDREVLEIFVESVEELQGSSFLEDIKRGISTSLTSGGGQTISQITGPGREATKAFLLTLRFFCQDNEQTSLRNMANRIPTLNVDQQLKDAFLKSRENFNRFLDSAPQVPVQGAGADNNREIFDAFVYGIFAHANPVYRRKVKGWESKPYYHALEAQFYVVLGEFLRAVSAMANNCRKMLDSGTV